MLPAAPRVLSRAGTIMPEPSFSEPAELRRKHTSERSRRWGKEEEGPCARYPGNAWYSGYPGPAIPSLHAFAV